MKCKIVAITGKIASGKSTVCAYLSSKGYFVMDCDKIAKDVLHQEEVRKKVENLLGKEAYVLEKLNVEFVAKKVFDDVRLLEEYSALVNLGVKEQIESKIDGLKGQIVFCEIARLDAFHFDWTQIWVVQTDKEIALNRAQGRGKDYVEKAYHLQKDYVGQVYLKNNGNARCLHLQIEQALKNV